MGVTTDGADRIDKIDLCHVLGTFKVSGVSRPRWDRKSLAVWNLVIGDGGLQGFETSERRLTCGRASTCRCLVNAACRRSSCCCTCQRRKGEELVPDQRCACSHVKNTCLNFNI